MLAQKIEQKFAKVYKLVLINVNFKIVEVLRLNMKVQNIEHFSK